MTAFRGQRGLREWDRFDGLLAFASLALVAYGLVLIYSGSLRSYDGPAASLSNPVAKQALFAAVAIGAMVAVSRLDYHHFLHYAWWLYGASIVALLVLIPIGQTEFGSTRWFELGPIQVQPSEFAKIATVLALARFLSDHGGDARDLPIFGMSLAVVAPLGLLVFVQPDLGTSIIFAAIWLGMIVVAGVDRSHLLMLAAAFIAVLPFRLDIHRGGLSDRAYLHPHQR